MENTAARDPKFDPFLNPMGFIDEEKRNLRIQRILELIQFEMDLAEEQSNRLAEAMDKVETDGQAAIALEGAQDETSYTLACYEQAVTELDQLCPETDDQKAAQKREYERMTSHLPKDFKL